MMKERHLGYVMPEEQKLKISESNSKPRPTCCGENRGRAWKGGVTFHPKYKQVMWQKRRAIQLGAIGSHTELEWNSLKKKYGYMCLCCKQQEPFIKLTQDHIVPLSMGGTDYISNIQPLCQSCNSRKGTKTINFWVDEDWKKNSLAEAIGFTVEHEDEE